MRLHHVQVIVPIGHTDDVLPFYVDLLGLTRVPKPGSAPGAWLTLDDGRQVHVSERSGSVHPDQHLALVAEDFDLVVARIKAAGAPWEPKPDLLGARRGMTADPHGNAVEVLEPAGAFAR